MTSSTLWEPDKMLEVIPDIKPQLASWDKLTHPSQIRLQAYRQPIMDKLILLLPKDEPLYLHLDVDVEQPARHLKRMTRARIGINTQ